MNSNTFMKEEEDEYITNFINELTANVITVGGTGNIVDPTNISSTIKLMRHLFPNGIEFKVHNRRMGEDSLREREHRMVEEAPGLWEAMEVFIEENNVSKKLATEIMKIIDEHE